MAWWENRVAPWKNPARCIKKPVLACYNFIYKKIKNKILFTLST